MVWDVIGLSGKHTTVILLNGYIIILLPNAYVCTQISVANLG